uniref:Histone H2AX n=1 Tax=Rhizophora mucronata TaxID=61149 RepID=A0A2P2K338_RHIMU
MRYGRVIENPEP